MLNRRVNAEILVEWINEHNPQGHEKLSVKSKLSFPTIGLIRRGHVPRSHTRRKLATAIGISEDGLFPPVAAGEDEEAS